MEHDRNTADHLYNVDHPDVVARKEDVGLTGATPNNLIYIDGEPHHKISNENFIDHLEEVIRKRATELEQARAALEEQLIAKSTT